MNLKYFLCTYFPDIFFFSFFPHFSHFFSQRCKLNINTICMYNRLNCPIIALGHVSCRFMTATLKRQSESYRECWWVSWLIFLACLLGNGVPPVRAVENLRFRAKVAQRDWQLKPAVSDLRDGQGDPAGIRISSWHAAVRNSGEWIEGHRPTETHWLEIQHDVRNSPRIPRRSYQNEFVRICYSIWTLCFYIISPSQIYVWIKKCICISWTIYIPI